MSPRISVFVDGENVSAVYGEAILRIAALHGQVDFIRVYGNACALPAWKEMPGYRLIHAGTGKNATDILLVIDAMERALNGACEVILIASSDRDFTHLAVRLRERGLKVIGVGEAKTSDQFRAVCTKFELMEKQVEQRQPAGQVITPATASGLDQTVREIISINSTNGQGMLLKDLGVLMHSKHGIRISTYPEKTWRGYLKSRLKFFDLDPPGPDARVRFRPARG
jgi:NYN domain-containing protein